MDGWMDGVSVAEQSLVEHVANCGQCLNAPIVHGMCETGLALLIATDDEDE
jgi:hypothetical protein